MTLDSLGSQIGWLLVLSLVAASVTWTFTHEEITRDAREYFQKRSREDRNPFTRKAFYAFTCEYCLSHYVALGVVIFAGFRLLLPDWRGAVLAVFAMSAVANVYMSAFARLRLDVKAERLHTEAAEREIHGRSGKESPRRVS